MADHPHRRSTDRGWRRLLRENWYRDVWLIVTTLIALVGVVVAVGGSSGAQTAARQAKQAVRGQREGRRVAIGVTCAALSSVSQAGRSVIASSASSQAISSREEQGLEQLGFPPRAQREAAAQVAAGAYVRAISVAVERQVGRRGDRLVRPDGTLDCHRLEQLGDALR